MTLIIFFFLLIVLCNDSEDIIYNLKIYRFRYFLWCIVIISFLEKYNCLKYIYIVLGKEILLFVKYFLFSFYIFLICLIFLNFDYIILFYKNIIINIEK